MADKLFTYRGVVPGRGFRWIKARPVNTPEAKGPQLVLVPAQGGEGAGQEESYDLSELGVVLHRSLAETKLDPESILEFANKYGWLGIAVPVKSERASASGPVIQGELWTDWQKDISDMLQLVSLWDLYRSGNTAKLARHVVWEKDAEQKDQVVFYSHTPPQEGDPGHPPAPPAGLQGADRQEAVPKEQEGESGQPSVLGHNKAHSVIVAAATAPGLLEQIPPGDVSRPALLYLQQQLDHHLRGHAGTATPLVTWQPDPGRLVLQFGASNLRTALWLQLADAVVNNRTIERCLVCKRWFEVSPEASRSHKRFCSDACRVKAYRDRQGLARQLYFEKHKTFEEIAVELKSRVPTVRRWITGR
jgi:hypothetical protein